MRITKVFVSLQTQEKIFKKHHVLREEIENVFFDEPFFFRTRQSKYIAIGFIGKHVTVVFYHRKEDAEVITAYKSTTWQKNLYNTKWKK